MSAVILLIDEEVNLRLSIAQILREAGNVVVLAENRLEAVDLLKVLHFDLVLLDIKSTTNVEVGFIKELQESFSDIPLLILNACPRVGAPLQLEVSSEIRYLAKPVDPPAILETIHSMLN